MGILSAFRLIRSATELEPTLGLGTTSSAGREVGIRSPWSTSQLSKIAWSDIFGTAQFPVTRAEAMSIPAVAKARHLICSPLSRRPLRLYRGDQLVADQPSWLYRTNTPTHPNIRMLWTLDDLLFGGWALWALERGTGSTITDAVRVPPEWWTFGDHGEVKVNGDEVDRDDVLLFSGPFEGLLEVAAGTIRAARNIETAWAARVRNPVPAVDLHQTTDDQLEPDEIDQLIADWTTARDDVNGSVAYTPYNIEARALPTTDASSLFVEGRNAVRLDVANFTGLPAALLDGSTATASLTYSTQEGRRNEFVDYSLSMWQDPVEARLSMDDACPRGSRIAFDLSDLFTPQTGTDPVRED